MPAQWPKPGLDDTHFLLGLAIEKRGDKAGEMEAFRRAYPPAPQEPEHNPNYKELLRREYSVVAPCLSSSIILIRMSP